MGAGSEQGRVGPGLGQSGNRWKALTVRCDASDWGPGVAGVRAWLWVPYAVESRVVRMRPQRIRGAY